MTDREPSASSSTRIVAALREFIAALDRRVPRLERAGEIQIARDSAMLRNQAVVRIEELTHAQSDHQCYDQALVEAIMTDDGGPVIESGREAGASPQRSEAT
jgi:hypothetical protein